MIQHSEISVDTDWISPHRSPAYPFPIITHHTKNHLERGGKNTPNHFTRLTIRTREAFGLEAGKTTAERGKDFLLG